MCTPQVKIYSRNVVFNLVRFTFVQYIKERLCLLQFHLLLIQCVRIDLALQVFASKLFNFRFFAEVLRSLEWFTDVFYILQLQGYLSYMLQETTFGLRL